MESKIFDETQLWNLHTEETDEWKDRHVVVLLKDGSSITGTIKEVGCAANENKNDGVNEHLWTSIVIEKRISISKIKSLEID
jgi:hypothetical protein